MTQQAQRTPWPPSNVLRAWRRPRYHLAAWARRVKRGTDARPRGELVVGPAAAEAAQLRQPRVDKRACAMVSAVTADAPATDFPRRRFTVDEVNRMAAQGILGEDEPVEA